MKHSSSDGASIHTTYKTIIISKAVDKIIGQPTTKTTHLLEQQLTQAAGAVTTHQWGGVSGCITLVLARAGFHVATGVTTAVVTHQTKPLPASTRALAHMKG